MANLNPKPKPVPSPTPPAKPVLSGMSAGAQRYARNKYKDEYAKYVSAMTKYENYKVAMKEYKKLQGLYQ